MQWGRSWPGCSLKIPGMRCTTGDKKKITYRSGASKGQETLSLRSRSCFFPKFWDLSSQPNLRLRLLSRGVCLNERRLQTTKPRFQNHEWTRTNYESIRPDYTKVLDCSRSHISKLRIRISRLRTEILKGGSCEGGGNLNNWGRSRTGCND